MESGLEGVSLVYLGLLSVKGDSSLDNMMVVDVEERSRKISDVGGKESGGALVGLVEWIELCGPKSSGFDSSQGHMPGLWAPSLVGSI